MLYTAPFLHFNHVLDAVFLFLQIDPSTVDVSRLVTFFGNMSLLTAVP
jgi:hypothetical protein